MEPPSHTHACTHTRARARMHTADWKPGSRGPGSRPALTALTGPRAGPSLGLEPGARGQKLPGFWHGESDLTPLCLSFRNYKMRRVIVAPSQGGLRWRSAQHVTTTNTTYINVTGTLSSLFFSPKALPPPPPPSTSSSSSLSSFPPPPHFMILASLPPIVINPSDLSCSTQEPWWPAAEKGPPCSRRGH